MNFAMTFNNQTGGSKINQPLSQISIKIFRSHRTEKLAGDLKYEQNL